MLGLRALVIPTIELLVFCLLPVHFRGGHKLL